MRLPLEFLLAFGAVSTLALGSAWLAARMLTSLAARETVWKAALLLTLMVPVAYTAAIAQRQLQSELVSVRVRDPRVLRELGVPRLEVRPQVREVKRVSPLVWWARAKVPPLLLALGGLSLLRVLLAWRKELRALGRRTPLRPGPAAAHLLREPALRGVRLTVAPGIRAPGVVNAREICLPEEDVLRAETDDLLAVIAHEAAHVERGDLTWSRLAGLASAFFFFQPLLLVARRDLAAIAEFQADEAAVRRTGNAPALVEALLGYAHRAKAHAGAATLGFGSRDSQFVQRARRILERRPGRPAPRALRWLPAAVALLAAAIALQPSGSTQARRARGELVAVRSLDRGPDAPLVEVSQRSPRIRREASVLRTPEGALAKHFLVDGRPAAATAELEAWLLRTLTNPAPSREDFQVTVPPVPTTQ